MCAIFYRFPEHSASVLISWYFFSNQAEAKSVLNPILFQQMILPVLGGPMASSSNLKRTRTVQVERKQQAPSRKTRTTRISRVSKYRKLAAQITNVKRVLLGATTSTSTDQQSSKVTPIQTRFASRYELMLERIRKHKEYSSVRTSEFPFGAFSGRPIIGEFSRICGGVYLSPTAREAIVVDEQYGSLEMIYSQLMVNFVRKNGTRVRQNTEGDLVRAAIELTQQKLTYVSEETITMLGQKEVLRTDEKVALDVFIEHGLGTARHQVLLAAYLLERLKDKGYLHGQIILDGVMLDGPQTAEKLVYNSESGDLYVFEPDDALKA
jgi:hypothetical protein